MVDNDGPIRVEQILIGVPCRGQVHAATMVALENERTLNPALSSIAYSTNYLSVYQGREALCDFFMANPQWQVLIMVDSDVVPPPNVVHLASHMAAIGDYDVVAIAYPVFQPQVAPLPVLAAYEHQEGLGWRPFGDCWARRGIQEVDAVGFGTVAIHRRVLETLPRPWFQQDRDDISGEWFTDDVSFCLRAREHGFKIGCDFDMQGEHCREVELLTLMQGVLAVIDDTVSGSNKGVNLIRARRGRPPMVEDAATTELPQGWLTEEEASALCEIAAGKTVLELGSYRGRSTVALAQTAELVVAVDHHHGDAATGGGDTLTAFLQNVRNLPNVIPVVADFATAAQVLLFGRGFDLAYVDGAHDHASVKHDVTLALEVAELVVVHDYGLYDVASGVAAIGARVEERLAGSLATVAWDPAAAAVT